MTVYVSIGNSDDKLTQAEWHDFCVFIENAIEHSCIQFYGRWYSLPNARFQNACWAFEVTDDEVGRLKRELGEFALVYRQDSIAWAIAETEFING